MDVPLLTEVCFAFRSFFRDFKIIIRNNSGQLKPEVKFLKVNKNLLKNEYIAANLPHSLIGKTELFPLLFPIIKSEKFFPSKCYSFGGESGAYCVLEYHFCSTTLYNKWICFLLPSPTFFKTLL